jgi:multiple sugar transport system substrate-binding protein
MSNNYSRRRFIEQGLAGLASLSLAGLAGCQAPAVSQSVQGLADLQMLFWGTETRNKLTRQAIGLFQKRYLGTTITSQYMEFPAYWPKLETLIKDGKTPDLIQMDIRYLSLYVRRGLLLDLTQFIYNQTIDLSDYDPLLLYSSKANNTIYGIPTGSNCLCMFYDKVLLEQSGLDLPESMSWSTFAEFMIKFSKGSNNSVYGTSDHSVAIALFENWIRSRGKELYTYDGKLGFAVADVVDWYTYWSELRKAGGCLPAHIQAAYDNNTVADTSLIKRKTFCAINHSNLYETYQKAASHPLGVAVPPQGDQPALYLKVAMMMSITAQTKYPTEAASFISFINNDIEGVKALGLERGMPGSAQARALLTPQLTPIQRTIVDYVDFVLKNNYVRIKRVIDPPGADKVSNSLTKIAREIASGKTSIPEGANIFYTQARKAIGQA